MRGIVLLLLPAALLAADHKTAHDKKPAAAKTSPAVSTAAPAIPEGAVEINSRTYRYTDKSGKTWIYYRTPFGISRAEEHPADAKPEPPVETKKPPLKIAIHGDEVRFERKSPFGTQVWTKKKSELTDEEKAWVAEQHSDADGSASRTKTTEK